MAVLFVAASILAHIYIGTLGMEGAFEAMGTGDVDLNWAREHHDQLGSGTSSLQATRGRRAPEYAFSVAGRVNFAALAMTVALSSERACFE